jgi:hypothetical protein
MGRVTELAKHHPSVPRHPIDGDKHLGPAEIGSCMTRASKQQEPVLRSISITASSSAVASMGFMAYLALG